MNERDIRLECIRHAQMGVKEVGGSNVPLNTAEIIDRAEKYYKFIIGEIK